MLFSLFGPPCPMTKWGVHLVRTIVQVVLGEHDFMSCSTVDELQKAWAERKQEHVIFSSDCPASPVANMFLRGRTPIIMFAEEPYDIVGYVMAERKIDLRGAIRIACHSLATLHDLYLDERVLVISRPRNPQYVRSLLAVVAEHLSLHLSEKNISEILLHLDKNRRRSELSIEDQIDDHIPLSKPVGHWTNDFSSEDYDLVRMVIDPLDQAVRQVQCDKIFWPREMFLSSDQPLKGAVEMTGKPRHFVYGPYLYLPPGKWIARPQIEIAGNLSNNTVAVDVYNGEILLIGQANLPAYGAYIVELEIEIQDARLPVEIRIANERGAIEGWLDLVRVELSRV